MKTPVKEIVARFLAVYAAILVAFGELVFLVGVYINNATSADYIPYYATAAACLTAAGLFSMIAEDIDE